MTCRHDLARPDAQPRGSRRLWHWRPRGAAPLHDDIDEPCELSGSNRFANPQEHLIAAPNACIMVGYVAQCSVRGITLENPAIETERNIDLRSFLCIDPAVMRGYDNLRYKVRLKGNSTNEQFAEIHEVMPTSSDSYNLSRPVALKPTLVIDCMCRRSLNHRLPRLCFCGVSYGSTAEVVRLTESVSLAPESRALGKSNQSSLACHMQTFHAGVI